VWPFLETGRYLKTFDKLVELGQGGYGTVSKVQHKLDGRIYALKIIRMHI
jgi:serine/threonine protein kinase